MIGKNKDYSGPSACIKSTPIPLALRSEFFKIAFGVVSPNQ
jgi:hypothetical protein